MIFVVGDVTPQEVFRARGQVFRARSRRRRRLDPVTTKEPPQLGERRIRIERDAQTPWLAMAWHAFAAPERQTRVMEVLLAILGDGDSSRLHQRLVETGARRRRSGYNVDQGFDPGLAWIYAIVPPGGDTARTERLIDEEIARIAHDGPTPAELTKARNQALASFWRGLETIDGKAEALGTYEVFHGDYPQAVRRAGCTRASRPRTCARSRRRCCEHTTAPSVCSSRHRRRAASPEPAADQQEQSP